MIILPDTKIIKSSFFATQYPVYYWVFCVLLSVLKEYKNPFHALILIWIGYSNNIKVILKENNIAYMIRDESLNSAKCLQIWITADTDFSEKLTCTALRKYQSSCLKYLGITGSDVEDNGIGRQGHPISFL